MHQVSSLKSEEKNLVLKKRCCTTRSTRTEASSFLRWLLRLPSMWFPLTPSPLHISALRVLMRKSWRHASLSYKRPLKRAFALFFCGSPTCERRGFICVLRPRCQHLTSLLFHCCYARKKLGTPIEYWEHGLIFEIADTTKRDQVSCHFARVVNLTGKFHNEMIIVIKLRLRSTKSMLCLT